AALTLAPQVCLQLRSAGVNRPAAADHQPYLLTPLPATRAPAPAPASRSCYFLPGSYSDSPASAVTSSKDCWNQIPVSLRVDSTNCGSSIPRRPAAPERALLRQPPEPILCDCRQYLRCAHLA